MKLRTFFMIVAILGLLFAIGLILAPAFMDTTYGTGPTAGEMLTDRLYGSGLLTLAAITWLAKDMTGASVRPIITGSLIGGVVGFLVSLMGMLGGVMNSTGWSTVVIYLLLTVGFAYFQFMAPPK